MSADYSCLAFEGLSHPYKRNIVRVDGKPAIPGKFPGVVNHPNLMDGFKQEKTGQ